MRHAGILVALGIVALGASAIAFLPPAQGG